MAPYSVRNKLNLVLTVFAMLALFLLVYSMPVFAGGFKDKVGQAKAFFDMVGGLKTILPLLGVSLGGFFGLVAPLRKAVKELLDVVGLVKALVNKYTHIPELQDLRREVEEAISATADVFDKIPFCKGWSDKLRRMLK